MKPFAFRSAAAVAVLVVVGAGVWGSNPAAARLTAHRPARPTAHRPARPAASPAASPASKGALTSPIKHVVVIYLENHSFDSILGFWCDDNPGRCPWNGDPNGGGMPASVTLSDGTVVTPFDDPDTVPRVRHETIDQQEAIDGGKMDGWQLVQQCSADYNYRCVSGYEPGQEPNLAALATTYAISDMTFSMQDSPSWFGHLYAVAASTDHFTGNNPWHATRNTLGIGWGCDSNSVATHLSPQGATTTVPSCIPDYSLPEPNGGAFAPTHVRHIPTIMDRLNAAKLTWRIYAAVCETASVNALGLRTCVKAAPGYLWSICPSFAEMLYSGRQCAGTENKSGDGLVPSSQFIVDAAGGALPAFSVVTPSGVDSEHNGFSMTQGDNWLGSLVQAVMNGPDWASTAIFITWDDCGCFYDQVPPGTNPDGTPQGPRVPMVIVSPYAKPGYTDTTPTTFAGILAYTEHLFGLTPLGVNDASAYDFSNAFDYSQSPLKRLRLVRRPLPASARRISPATQDPS